MRYWLIKSEEDEYPISALKKDKRIDWFGVRNYQARNFMRDDMRVGDLALFYHSNAKVPSVYGVAKVVSAPHADMTQFDSKHKYFEPRATKEKPIWMCVDFGYVSTFKNPVSLFTLKLNPKTSLMLVAKKGQRLSVQPVDKKHFDAVVNLGQ